MLLRKNRLVFLPSVPSLIRSLPASARRFILDENINNNTGISILAVFDGHGGDFAADYAKDVLIQNLYNKIIEAHNIVTGKVDPNAIKSASANNNNNNNKKATDAGEGNGGECNAGKKEGEPPKTPVMNGTERRNSFRKTTSFADDSIKKRSQQPDPIDIYKLNGLTHRMTKDDFLLPAGGKANGQAAKVAPQSLEAKCYITADGKINFGKLLTDEVLAADHKLVETVKKMVSSGFYLGSGGIVWEIIKRKIEI